TCVTFTIGCNRKSKKCYIYEDNPSKTSLSKAIKSNRVTASRLVKRLLSKKIINSFVPPKKKRKLFVFSRLIKLMNY
ncbi:hypothetical protein J7K44_02490, partial [bacterium]|nr:hypothetical protein [bacterium]